MTLRPVEASDAQLVAAARNGQQAAFRELTERHRDAVYRLVRSAIGDSDEALDVTQEALIAAFGALGRYDPQRPFRAWIARIALNKSRDWARRRAVRRLFSFALPEGAADAAISDDVPADRAAEDRETLERASAAIAELPARLKDVLLLRSVEQLSQAETAGALGISEKAVETRLYRARVRLREKLEG